MNNKVENKKVTQDITPEVVRNESFYTPNVDIFEEKEQINLITELSGIEEKNLDVVVEDNILTISAKMKDEKFDNYELIYSEYRPITYKRKFTISNEFDKDKLKATFKNGILNISIPKLEKTPAKKIKVKLV